MDDLDKLEENYPEEEAFLAEEELSEPSELAESQEASYLKPKKVKSFTFLRGLFSTLGAAFLVATLLTFWTPGSLVESGLEAKMALALEGELQQDTGAQEENLAGSSEEAYANRIGLVAGHYGSDSGAVCSDGLTEVEMNLKITTLVQKGLVDRGYEVDLLEEFDSRLAGYKAAVLVSVHLDSCEYINDQATGFKVAAALSSGSAANNQRLISCLSTRYSEITGLPYHAGSVTNDMTYYHAFSEIDPGTEAAIIEAGFMNRDYNFITEETDKIAEGIISGILCYLNNEIIQPTPNP